MGAPQQKRSRQTFDKIVRAAQSLLTANLFEDLTVQEIVDEAGSTVGSFYNLFGSKEALLPELYRHHCAEMQDRLQRFLGEKTANATLQKTVRGLVEEIVQLHRTQRGLLRALVLQAHCFPQQRAAERPSEMAELLSRVAQRVVEVAGGAKKQVVAARLGLLAVLSTVREIYLYPQTSAQSLQINEQSLVQELAEMWLVYIEGKQ